MSKRINLLLILIFIILVIGACNSAKIPAAYLHNPNSLKNSITGSWIQVTLHTDSGSYQKLELSGELIAIQSDTLFVLSEAQLSAIKVIDIDDAKLYIFKNQSGRFALLTGMLFIPDIIGAIAYSVPAFLILGIPVLTVGSAIAIAEGFSGSNMLVYPGKNSIEEFRKFTRFPAGIPYSVNRNELHLLKKPTHI